MSDASTALSVRERRQLALLGVGLSALAIAALANAGLPTGSDFLALYAAVLGWWDGVPLYDEAAQELALAAHEGVDPARVSLPPFAYPPWMAGLTLPLGLVGRHLAYATWLVANLWMALGAVWAFTADRTPRERVLLSLVGLLYVPLLGVLSIGQFTLPAVLGAGVALVAVRRGRPAWFAVGVLLLLFKPHLGLGAGLAALLATRAGALGTGRAVQAGVAALVGCLALGTLVEPSWFRDWPDSLRRFGAFLDGSCDTCASLPYAVTGGGGPPALAVGAAAAALLGGVAWRLRSRWWGDLARTLALGAAVTPLVLPYARNYDYVILLPGLLWLARPGWTGVLALAAWALPTLALGLDAAVATSLWWGSALAVVGGLLGAPNRAAADPAS